MAIAILEEGSSKQEPNQDLDEVFADLARNVGKDHLMACLAKCAYGDAITSVSRETTVSTPDRNPEAARGSLRSEETLEPCRPVQAHPL